MKSCLFLVLVLAVAPALAQQSSSFRVSGHVFNDGGNPAAGINPESASFRITLSSIGEAFAMMGLSSTSFRTEAGFGAISPPPGEVLGLRFQDRDTLVWSGERSAVRFNLYRDGIGMLSDYGVCLQPDLVATTTDDTDQPVAGDGYFYLVTAVNRLDEEGSLGRDGSGLPRANDSPCP